MKKPRFLKGRLQFRVKEFTVEFRNRRISLFGVTGLPWQPLSSTEHFGLQVQANITVNDTTLGVQAVIIRESTLHGKTMGLKFLLDDETQDQLSDLIEKHGPKQLAVKRKYPRIPSLEEVQTFPIRAVASPTDWSRSNGGPMIRFKVGNLSPEGMLLITEEPDAKSIRPGNRLYVTLMPCDTTRREVRVYGHVCRVTDEVNPASGSVTQSFAIRLISTYEGDRKPFFELLKDILQQLEKSHSDS